MIPVDIAKKEKANDIVRYVDFDHTELCSDCNPVNCTINGDDVPVGTTWRDLLMRLIEKFTKETPDRIKELYNRPLLIGSARPFLLKDRPNGATKQTSTGHWVYVNLNISTLVDLIGKLCKHCGVDLHDVKIAYAPKSTNRNTYLERERNDASSVFAELNIRGEFMTWLIEQHPDWTSGTVSMHFSDAYFLFNNRFRVTLKDALTYEDGMQQAYDVIEQHFMDNPTQTDNPSGSARGYIRSLRMLKEFIEEKYPALLNISFTDKPVSHIPAAIIDVLKQNYAAGFRFDVTYVNLLSSASGLEIDVGLQSALKRIMFRRNDNIYFLLDIVTDADTRKDIVDFADTYLQEYGCFEILEFYKLYEGKVNPNCIRNADDFEDFYKQIGRSGVRCVRAPQIGNRIARYSSGSVWGTFSEVAAKLVAVIHNDYYGSCNEEDLHTEFCAFSTDLLGKIIKHCAADELIRVEINGSICYQTFDALGLPENFSNVLTEILERLVDIRLDLTQDVLHTAISLKLGVNFKEEFNLSDWDAFRRLITAFYEAEPKREWKANIFWEVTN